MKGLVAFFFLFLSINSFAYIKATDGVGHILKQGVYEGKSAEGKCYITIAFKEDSVLLQVKNPKNSETFVLLNESNNYFVSENLNEVSANENLNFPHYENGGTKNLLLRTHGDQSVEIFISTIKIDHHGNDMSTYLGCKISL